MRAQGDGVIGCDHALVVQAQATSQIETAGQGAKVASGVGGRAGEALVVIGAELMTGRSWQVRQARSMRPLTWVCDYTST